MFTTIVSVFIACTFIVLMPYVCLYFEFSRDVKLYYKLTGKRIKLEKNFFKRIKQYDDYVRFQKNLGLAAYYIKTSLHDVLNNINK